MSCVGSSIAGPSESTLMVSSGLAAALRATFRFGSGKAEFERMIVS